MKNSKEEPEDSSLIRFSPKPPFIDPSRTGLRKGWHKRLAGWHRRLAPTTLHSGMPYPTQGWAREPVYSFATSVTFSVDKRLISNKLFEQLPKTGISKNFIVVAKIRKKHLYMKLERFFRKNNEATRIMSPHPSLSWTPWCFQFRYGSEKVEIWVLTFHTPTDTHFRPHFSASGGIAGFLRFTSFIFQKIWVHLHEPL